MVFQIKLAERIIEIHSIYKFSYYYCREYWSDENEIDFIVYVNMNEINDEMSRQYPSFARYNNRSFEYIAGHTEFMIILKKISERMAIYSTFLFHGAVVSDGKNGHILAAPSGVGKTTRARIFANSFAEGSIVNGDKPLIQVNENLVIAYGTPWCGKEYIGKNVSIQLKNIFLLSRGRQTNIKKLALSEAIPFLIKQTYFPDNKDNITTIMQLLIEMSKKVNIFQYVSKPDGDDILEAYYYADKFF